MKNINWQGVILALVVIFVSPFSGSIYGENVPNPCVEEGPHAGSEDWDTPADGSLSGELSISSSSVTVSKGKVITQPTANTTLTASDATQDGTRTDTYDCSSDKTVDLPQKTFSYSSDGATLTWTGTPASGPPSSINSKGTYSYTYTIEQVFTNSNSEISDLEDSISGTFTVTVLPMSASIDKTTLTCEEKTATITVSGDYNAQFSSSDTSVATVSGGIVTAVGEGTATITVLDHDGDKETFSVTVENSIESIDHSIPSYVPASSSTEYTVTVTPCFEGFVEDVEFSESEATVTRVSGTKNQFTVTYPNASSAIDASTITFSYDGVAGDSVNTTAVEFARLTDKEHVCLDMAVNYTLTTKPADADIPITWSIPNGGAGTAKTQNVTFVSKGDTSVTAAWESLSLTDNFKVYELELSGDSKINVGSEGIVTISGGTGSYRAKSSKPDYASVKVNGSTITIEGLKATVEGEKAEQDDLVVITVYDDKSGCTEEWGVLIADCVSCLCETGDDITGLNSLNVSMGLGKYAKVVINELKPSVELSTPAVFEFTRTRSNVETVYENDMLRQVYDGQYLSDIVIVDQYSYTVKVYKASGLTIGTDGLYPTTGLELAKQTTIANPDRNSSNTHITVEFQNFTGTTGSHTEFSDFYFDTNSNAWSLGKGPGQGAIQNREKLVRDQTFLNFDPQFTLESSFDEKEEAGLAQSFAPGSFASVEEDFISDLVTLQSMTFNTSTAADNTEDQVELRIYSSFSDQSPATLVASSQNTHVLNVADSAFTWNFANIELDKETTYYASFYSNGQPVAPSFFCGFDSYFGGNAIDGEGNEEQ